MLAARLPDASVDPKMWYLQVGGSEEVSLRHAEERLQLQRFYAESNTVRHEATALT